MTLSAFRRRSWGAVGGATPPIPNQGATAGPERVEVEPDRRLHIIRLRRRPLTNAIGGGGVAAQRLHMTRNAPAAVALAAARLNVIIVAWWGTPRASVGLFRTAVHAEQPIIPRRRAHALQGLNSVSLRRLRQDGQAA